MSLNNQIDQAVWIARSLYERGKTSGSSANLSILYKKTVYITASGCCFGALTANDFAAVSLNGNSQGGKIPSKELPLHLAMYQKEVVRAVIHVHSPFGTLWSCLQHSNHDDVIPAYTPYLDMKLGPVASVPYAPPGSDALFEAFRSRIGPGDGYLLQNHGPIVGGPSLMEAYYRLEELEESTRIAWLLRNEPDKSAMLIRTSIP